MLLSHGMKYNKLDDSEVANFLKTLDYFGLMKNKKKTLTNTVF